MSSFPTPSYNPNIPVLTSEGASPLAYNDPNSPESIMKKLTLTSAQVAVDRKFDSTAPTHESFISSVVPEFSVFSYQFVLSFLFVFAFIYSLKLSKKSSRYSSLNFLLFACFLFYLSLYYFTQ